MSLCCTLSVIPHISLSCLMLCHSFSPSYLPQVFRYSPPGCCWWCGEVQGALLSSCQGLCGPRGAPAKGPGQFYCPDAFQSMKDIVGSEGGGVGKRGPRRVGISLWAGDLEFVRGWLQRAQIASPLLLLHPSCPVLSLEELQGRRMHLPEIHTPQGQTPISPISKVLQKHCICHTGVHLHSSKGTLHCIGLLENEYKTKIGLMQILSRYTWKSGEELLKSGVVWREEV